MAHSWRSCILIALFLGSCASAAEDDFRILYSEAIGTAARIVPDPGAEDRAHLSFEAYGRHFDLELQSNRRLLNALPDVQKQQAEGNALYRGRVKGVAGSWVRLTQVGTELHGAIWDGQDLYAIEPARTVAPLSISPPTASGSAPTVYRLSDVYLTPGSKFCGLDVTEERKTALAAYDEVVSELTALAASGSLAGQIQVSALADAQFASFQLDPQGAVLARMNIVDGIFSEQVGIAIVVPEVRVFNNGNNPFTSNTPTTLLGQLANYRNSDASLRGTGLTHMFTGRDLTGDTVGIAYLSSLCHSRFGSSLSESRSSTLSLTTSALIAAHEIGHNFGAPHDGETGSACAASAQTFLMAPRLNGSNTFSQCSVDQMAPSIATASCIEPPQSDVSVAVDPSGTAAITGVTGNAVSFSATVTADGIQDSTGVFLNVAAVDFTVQSATIDSGTCTVQTNGVTCFIGALARGASRRLDVSLRGTSNGNHTVTVTTGADNDDVSANNTRSLLYTLIDPSDAALTGNTASVSGTLDQNFSYAFEVWVSGALPVYDVKVSLPLPTGFSFVGVNGGSVPCTFGAGAVSCDIGDLSSGARRQIDLNLRASAAGSFSTTATLNALNDTEPQNDARTLPVYISAPGAPAPVQSQSGGGGGGGGGGGSFGWLSLLALGILACRDGAGRPQKQG